MIGIDIKMPKRCGECPIAMRMSCIPDVFYCPAIRQQITCEGHGENRHPDCPLHPIDDEIRVGDEVYLVNDESIKGVVIEQLLNDSWTVFTENGCTEFLDKKEIRRTGRHFDEVEILLKKMRGEDDG